jgi:hypothetical protein
VSQNHPRDAPLQGGVQTLRSKVIQANDLGGLIGNFLVILEDRAFGIRKKP